MVKFDRNILSEDVARFFEALRNAGRSGASDRVERLLKYPITGITACCVRTIIGHVAAAPPTRPINSRRLMHAPGQDRGIF
jgi:hypothetical protein